jgi:mercuric ion transport protein
MKTNSSKFSILGTLISGGLAALLASACCLGPLVLISAGISGAWLSQLTLLEPYSPWLIAASMIALIFAYRRIWRPRSQCGPNQVCSIPEVSRAYKIFFVISASLLVSSLLFPAIAHLFY